MKIFSPSTTMSSPSGVNRVFMPVASEPAEVSVIASAPSPPSAILGSSRAFCSSLPASISDFNPLKVVDQTMPVEAQASVISLTTSR